MGKKAPSRLPTNTKYKLYESAVQNPENDVEFMVEWYEKFNGKSPKVLREDFCGTGMISCEWAKSSDDRSAIGIDLDPEPVEIGKERHYSKLSEDAQKRVEYKLENVLSAENCKADCIAAFNFSYFIFKKRSQLVEYFTSARKSLNPGGVFFIDLFGGTECHQELEEETEHDKFSYYWDCDKFNAITGEAKYAIHFEHKGRKYKNVFTYDWRHWSLPELMDILEDAGFTERTPFWEGDDDDGTGDGEFYIASDEENCESWVTYIAARP
ncbi:MAG: class I SAM-dependent methyltransferase [Bacteriovoracaceae bacterium]|nr:class I SAM-dependent methyltransferase [Bacteriovoracaceae bacterium]